MKDTLYTLLVTRNPEVHARYLELRRSRPELSRAGLLLRLLLLNLRLGLRPARMIEEQPRLHTGGSESALSRRESPAALADRLAVYGVISFDVFDTLILRPFSDPADLFDWIGAQLDYPDFKPLRIWAERQARRDKARRCGTPEVTLREIWAVLSDRTGIPAERGAAAELEWERRCCRANPYFLETVRILRQRGCTCVAASDMYLGRSDLAGLLEQCGYPPFAELFISCEEGVGKHDGGLYDRIRTRMGAGSAYVHLGDNERSDQDQARRHGLDAVLYPNVNRAGAPFRARGFSPLVGSLYRGIVNAHLHSGAAVYPGAYEYGFICGGLFAVGYCRFIHQIVQQRQLDRILFLARDGAVLREVYLRLYPAERARTRYALWSRLAAIKLAAPDYRHEYFLRLLDHRAGQGRTIEQILESMEIPELLPGLCRTLQINSADLLTHKNAPEIKKYLLDHWDRICEAYRGQSAAARRYYSRLLRGASSAAAVDVGWAGSGAVLLHHLVNGAWGLNCPITGILAGTNSRQSPVPDTPEPLLFSGRLVSYLFRQGENRDLWKFHDPYREHNLYWELLLSSAHGSLKGFYPGDRSPYRIRLKPNRPDPEPIRQIHRGILDFVQLFQDTERRLGQEIPVTGRDAYVPMLPVLERKNKKFRRQLEALLDDIQLS